MDSYRVMIQVAENGLRVVWHEPIIMRATGSMSSQLATLGGAFGAAGMTEAGGSSEEDDTPKWVDKSDKDNKFTALLENIIPQLGTMLNEVLSKRSYRLVKRSVICSSANDPVLVETLVKAEMASSLLLELKREGAREEGDSEEAPPDFVKMFRSAAEDEK
jgi:hypothetical protein